mmetsp:Transcript_6830/g.12025  ORF Transcript_6830/g.12025 Transcript_6830/m.12025 type:complete len:218 (+) Transcript_6830:60-713(+)
MSGGCPFRSKDAAAKQGNANEVLNPRNLMPEMSQEAAEDQKGSLSKHREVSTIPKTHSEENWVYPSPQQFYNALLRRNKEAEEGCMEDVVRVHNATNERTWDLILDWESQHRKICPTPSLLRFVGRSEELSLGARWSKHFSYRGIPFDRHDWYVDRCGLKVVRYVIDYYDDPLAKNDAEITIDARPAFDSFGAAVDRLRRPRWQLQRMWTAIFGPSH